MYLVLAILALPILIVFYIPVAAAIKGSMVLNDAMNSWYDSRHPEAMNRLDESEFLRD